MHNGIAPVFLVSYYVNNIIYCNMRLDNGQVLYVCMYAATAARRRRRLIEI